MMLQVSVSGQGNRALYKVITYLLIAAMLAAFLPVTGTVNADPLVETTLAEGFFTPSETFYNYFVPGVIRPDEGTMEMTVRIDKPISEFGNTWDFLFTLVPVQPNIGNTLMGAYVPPAPDTGITFLLRNGTNRYELNVPGFSYTPGEPFNLAFSWKAGGYLHIYKNAVEIGSATAIGSAFQEKMLPYNFSVEKSDPYHTSKIKVSTSQLSSVQLASNPSLSFSADTGMTSLISNDMINTTKPTTSWHTSSQYSSLMPAFRSETQSFTVGDNVYYPLVSINYASAHKEYTVQMSVYDAYGNAKLSRSTPVTVANDGLYKLNKLPLPELNSAGYYDIQTSIVMGGLTIAQYSSAISVLPVHDAAVSDGVLASYYGQTPNYNYDPSIWGNLNVNVARAWEGGSMFLWNKIEPTQGNFTWEKTDSYVARNMAAGMDTLAVLGYPSRWAAEESTVQTAQNYLTQLPERWMPKSLEEWGNYVYQTVSRYKGKVKYWEIWNEVNFHPPYLPAAFSGSTQDYLDLLQTAYTQAKLADPDSLILVSGFSSVTAPNADSSMPLAITDAVYASGYYDIYNVHGYNGAAAIQGWIDNLKVQQPGKKYWMSEYFSYTSPDSKVRISETLESYLSFLEHGYDKYINMGVPSDNAFINRYTQSPSQVFQAVGVMQHNIRKTNSLVQKYSGFPHAADFPLRHLFSRTDGKYLSILGTESAPYDIYIDGTIDSATDVYGNVLVLQVTDNISKISTSNTAFIISSQPLQITNTVNNGPVITQFAKNGGFELITGDPSAGGLSSVTPNNWSLRKTTYDSAGDIVVSDQAASGSYAVSVKSSGLGRVYVTQDFAVPSAGRYTLTAKFKKVSGDASLQPYLFFFNRDTLQISQQSISDASTTQYGTYSMLVDILTKPVGGESIGLGIYSGAGEVLIDDVTVTRSEIPASIIIDNADSSGVTVTGSWGVSSSNAQKNGADYLHDQNAGKASKSVQFTPDLAASGYYDVYMWWPAGSNFASKAPVLINSAAGTYSTTVNQQTYGGAWNLLGSFPFNSGTSGHVTINNTGTSGFVIADAVKFVQTAVTEPITPPTPPTSPVHVDIIKDNSDPTGISVTGSWAASSGNAQKYGADYWNDQNTSKGAKSVQYTPNIPTADDYDVYLWWPAGTSYATNVSAAVYHAAGSYTTTINQSVNANGGKWNLIGQFPFSVGTTGHVTISNGGTSGFVVADAVRFVQKTLPFTAVTGISVSGAGNAATVAKNGTLAMSASVLPGNATNTSITWSIANGSGRAFIHTDTGVLTGTGAGTVTVTATARDGSGVTGSLQVTVTP